MVHLWDVKQNHGQRSQQQEEHWYANELRNDRLGRELVFIDYGKHEELERQLHQASENNLISRVAVERAEKEIVWQAHDELLCFVDYT